jgi:hypothetical protein
VQPRCERGVATKTREAAVRADKRILSDLFFVVAVTKQAEGRSKNFHPMAFHGFNEGGFLAGLYALFEVRLV